MKAVMREVLLSPEFWDHDALLRALLLAGRIRRPRAEGHRLGGFSVNDALTPLANMGQNLYEPPDVAGWDAGQAWFSTGAMLARMNFASALAANQKFNLARGGEAGVSTPPRATLLVRMCSTRWRRRHSIAARHRRSCSDYLRATGAVDRQRRADSRRRSPGLVHLDRPAARGVSVRMKVTRRQFVKGGVAAFTVTLRRPGFSAISRGRRARVRAISWCST